MDGLIPYKQSISTKSYSNESVKLSHKASLGLDLLCSGDFGNPGPPVQAEELQVRQQILFLIDCSRRDRNRPQFFEILIA